MKSIITVLGSFLFVVFCEFFIRVVIIFYHQSDLQFYGISNFPGTSWIIILYFAVAIATWIGSMLAVTITTFSPIKHLLALSIVISLWRMSEFFAMNEPNFYYTLTILFFQFVAIWLALISKQKINATTTTS